MASAPPSPGSASPRAWTSRPDCAWPPARRRPTTAASCASTLVGTRTGAPRSGIGRSMACRLLVLAVLPIALAPFPAAAQVGFLAPEEPYPDAPPCDDPELRAIIAEQYEAYVYEAEAYSTARAARLTSRAARPATDGCDTSATKRHFACGRNVSAPPRTIDRRSLRVTSGPPVPNSTPPAQSRSSPPDTQRGGAHDHHPRACPRSLLRP